MENMNENNIEKNNEEVSGEVLQKEPEDKKRRRGAMYEIFDWVKAIVIAVAVALLLRNFVLTLALVDGASMENTLHHGDRLYVNKLLYTPEKGDIVIIETDKHPEGPLVKRVIATEGDTIYIDPYTNEVYLNDKLLEEDYIKGKTVLPVIRDSLTGVAMGYTGELAEIFGSEGYSRENPIVVGEGEIFAMGDNRENSSDSRNLGLFKTEEVAGHALFRFWPLSDMEKFD